MFRFAGLARSINRSASIVKPTLKSFSKPLTPLTIRKASGYSFDPEAQAIDEIEEGTRVLNEGDVEGAKEKYQRSLDIQKEGKTAAMGLFNLGVTQFYTKDIQGAIATWEKSLAIEPTSDLLSNLASAHILSSPSNPAKAIEYLTQARDVNPDDPEVAFNLGVVSEATGQLESALDNYKAAKSLGVERAEENVRNVGAKIISERAKKAEQEE
ncbi:hypothetical protein E3P98_00878 [Wallemia ichthyophaga]|nr:hypothetical protein E3P98_00878 [Wallemia ichthyophaga]